MRIETYVTTTKDAVDSKEHNIWIGISLGNKYFTKAHIRKYIDWALTYTKESVLVAIIDDIHALNYEVFDKRPKDSALRKARRVGDKKAVEVQEIIRELPEEDRKRIYITRWSDLVNTKYHTYRQKLLFDEFESNKEFHNHIIEIISEGRGDRVAELSEDDQNYLAEYILREIPLFLNGAKYKTRDGWQTYSLIPYPGLGKLDELLIGLQNKIIFPELADKLKITDKIALLEAYVD